ncbi:MAG: Ectoine hydroxylase-related dioxygenase, phytanoyl-CoA dioxygenase (PhyH) family [Verrucomicrobia bacterium]|nr:Ectoine hydroxylase-related dioxygenase, phytanoyl-CoA dioxygenase (PhyH) family [Verrucomicrobiota bacterium]
MLEREAFVREFQAGGSVLVPGVLDPAFVATVKKELEAAIEAEVSYHGTRDYRDYGMVLLCSLYGGAFWRLFDNPGLTDPFNAVLGDGCIVYAYTSSSMPPNSGNYSGRLHVDSPRLIPGYVTNMGATILLDDFTEENGATWHLPASQGLAEAPDEKTFRAQARRVLAPAGSVWFFNARTWHAGGQNRSARWRHALTINMARPWMKQRIDIPRAMAHLDLSALSPAARQKLGFDAQVPASYAEYYAPPELRKFKQRAE